MLHAAENKIIQEAEDHSGFGKWREKWAAIGLNTDVVDRKRAEDAIKDVYLAAGLEPPRRIVWSGSPFSQGLVRAVVLDSHFLVCVAHAVWNHAKNHDGTRFRDDVIDSIGGSVRIVDGTLIRGRLKENVKQEVRDCMTRRQLALMSDNAKDSATAVVWDSVWESIWVSVWPDIWQSIEAGIKASLRKNTKRELDNMIMASLSNCIGANLKSKLWEYPMEKTWGDIRDSASSQVRVEAFDNLWGSLHKSIWEKIAVPIGECIKACCNDSPLASVYGQHDAYWLAFYDYLREAKGLKRETERMQGLLGAAQAAGWFIPHARICWVCERPTILCLDESGSLHAEDGPALAYSDGWRVYANKGEMRFSPALQ